MSSDETTDDERSAIAANEDVGDYFSAVFMHNYEQLKAREPSSNVEFLKRQALSVAMRDLQQHFGIDQSGNWFRKSVYGEKLDV